MIIFVAVKVDFVNYFIANSIFVTPLTLSVRKALGNSWLNVCNRDQEKLLEALGCHKMLANFYETAMSLSLVRLIE